MASNTNVYDFGIVGAGLSGLSSAATILEENPTASILLLERSGRVGGRILGTEGSVELDGARKSETTQGVDLGGAWVWPSSMPFTMEFIRRYNISLVQQEGSDGTKMRVKGGVTVLVEKLLQDIGYSDINVSEHLNVEKEGKSDKMEKVSLRLNSMLLKVQEKKDDNCVNLLVQNITDDTPLSISSENVTFYIVRHLVIAAPPAKIIEDILFEGSESRYITLGLKNKMKHQPIWMASAGKISLSYKEKFWNSGNIMMSLRPPNFESSTSDGNTFAGAFQVYDAGLNDNGEYTIVAFVTCGKREENPYSADMMAQIVAKQLDESAVAKTNSSSFSKYQSIQMKCWKTDKNINKLHDAEPYPLYPQPIFGLNDDTIDGRRIWFGGSEASEDWTGMIEGAVMNGTEIG